MDLGLGLGHGYHLRGLVLALQATGGDRLVHTRCGDVDHRCQWYAHGRGGGRIRGVFFVGDGSGFQRGV